MDIWEVVCGCCVDVEFCFVLRMLLTRRNHVQECMFRCSMFMVILFK